VEISNRTEALACNKNNVLKKGSVLSAKVANFLLRYLEKILAEVMFMFSTLLSKVIFFTGVKAEIDTQISL